MAENKFNPMKG